MTGWGEVGLGANTTSPGRSLGSGWLRAELSGRPKPVG